MYPCFLYSTDHGATANVATAHHGNNGNVLDEWVFNCQAATHSPLYSGKQVRGIVIPPPVS